jgi:hypothetical protein
VLIHSRLIALTTTPLMSIWVNTGAIFRRFRRRNVYDRTASAPICSLVRDRIPSPTSSPGHAPVRPIWLTGAMVNAMARGVSGCRCMSGRGCLPRRAGTTPGSLRVRRRSLTVLPAWRRRDSPREGPPQRGTFDRLRRELMTESDGGLARVQELWGDGRRAMRQPRMSRLSRNKGLGTTE